LNWHKCEHCSGGIFELLWDPFFRTYVAYCTKCHLPVGEIKTDLIEADYAASKRDKEDLGSR